MKRYIYFEVSSVAVADAVSVLSDVCVILVEEGGLDFCEWGSESESVFDVVLLLLLLLLLLAPLLLLLLLLLLVLLLLLLL